MACLTIKNIGPVSNVKLNLRAVNVLMGPQGCGKSTIAKIISFKKQRDRFLFHEESKFLEQ